MKIRIGELAKLFSCAPVTIRFYEKKGLMPKPKRTSGNYRIYDEADIERLRFIRHCRSHGINIEEIKTLLVFRDNPGRECGAVHKIVEKHLAEVDSQIRSLQSLKKELAGLGSACACDKSGQCSILRNLGAADSCSCCQELSRRQQG